MRTEIRFVVEHDGSPAMNIAVGTLFSMMNVTVVNALPNFSDGEAGEFPVVCVAADMRCIAAGICEATDDA